VIANVIAWTFLAVLLLAVVAVAATGIFVPKCGLCHSTGAFGAATKTAAHAKVACAKCHVAPGVVAGVEFSFRHVTHLIGPKGANAAVGTQAVPDTRCNTCHADVQTQIVSGDGLRIKHSACAKKSDCTDCHSNTAHGAATAWPKTFTMDQCLHCHGSEPRLSKCNLCHRGRQPKERITRGPWAVTHGANWRQTHGMGDQATCSACHPKNYCVKCHGPGLPHPTTFRRTHPSVAIRPDAKCTMCHKQTFCTDCHGLPMPHPLSFIKTHSARVKAEGTKLCYRCHSRNDCTTCHVMHVHPGGAVGIHPTPKVGR